MLIYFHYKLNFVVISIQLIRFFFFRFSTSLATASTRPRPGRRFVEIYAYNFVDKKWVDTDNFVDKKHERNFVKAGIGGGRTSRDSRSVVAVVVLVDRLVVVDVEIDGRRKDCQAQKWTVSFYGVFSELNFVY